MSLTSAQVQAKITQWLTLRGQFGSTEGIYASLSVYVEAAYHEHAPDNDGDFSLLPFGEYELVMLLAWARACMSRASFVAPQGSLKTAGSGFGSDRDTPFAKNTKLAELLREEYHRLKGQIAENKAPTDEVEAAGDITIGDLYRNDELVVARVPLYIAPTMKISSIYVGAIGIDTGAAGGQPGTGSVILSWNAMNNETFGELYLLQNASPGINEPWNGDGNGGATSQPTPPSLGVVPFAAASAIVIYRTTDSFQKAAKAINFAAGIYYFCLAIRDTTANYLFSNEVTVVIPPPPASNLIATPGSHAVALSWTASGNATSYQILRSTTTGTETVVIGTTSGTTYNDTTAASGTPYFYVVQALNNGANSANSNEATATPS